MANMLMSVRNQARCGHDVGPGGTHCPCCADKPSRILSVASSVLGSETLKSKIDPR